VKKYLIPRLSKIDFFPTEKKKMSSPIVISRENYKITITPDPLVDHLQGPRKNFLHIEVSRGTDRWQQVFSIADLAARLKISENTKTQKRRRILRQTRRFLETAVPNLSLLNNDLVFVGGNLNEVGLRGNLNEVGLRGAQILTLHRTDRDTTHLDEKIYDLTRAVAQLETELRALSIPHAVLLADARDAVGSRGVIFEKFNLSFRIPHPSSGFAPISDIDPIPFTTSPGVTKIQIINKPVIACIGFRFCDAGEIHFSKPLQTSLVPDGGLYVVNVIATSPRAQSATVRITHTMKDCSCNGEINYINIRVK
jgi:hypothetical protein